MKCIKFVWFKDVIMWTDPLASFFKALGAPSETFFNVQDSVVKLARLDV